MRTARPRVVVHSAASVDGRLDGFEPDVGLYYELAGRIPHQAVLSGSGTILAAARTEGIDLAGEDAGVPPRKAGAEPWLVLVDGRGRVTRLDWLRSAGLWREVLVLCTTATPLEHLDRLERAGVPHEVLGAEHVDLAAALRLLSERHAVTQVRVDAGPRLNGALLRAGLVDEISLLIAPQLSGHADEALHLFDERPPEPPRLRLTAVESLRDDHLWLRYEVPPS